MVYDSRFESPIGSSARRGRRPFSTESNRVSGASIGDVLKTSARIAGTTSMIGLLLNAGPMLLVSLAGILLLLRGCLSSWTTVPQPISQAPSTLTASPYAPRGLSQVPVATTSPARRPVRTQPQVLHEMPQQSNSVDLNNTTDLESGGYVSQYPNQYVLSFPSTPGLFMPNVGIFPAPAFLGGGFATTSNPMLDAVAAGPAMSESPSQAISPLFSFQVGRKFAGTSQMPGAPSRRIILSIAAIRDGGSNIAAKISTLEGASFSRAYTGLIEKDPWRLKLIPVRHPTSFGTFVTYMPWYSNSPTDIILEVSADGKSLAGTSVSSEQFELLPQFDISPDYEDDSDPLPQNAFVLDVASEGGTQWKLLERNREPVNEADMQCWTFTKSSSGSGSFSWSKKSALHASGNYLEGDVKGHIDIILESGSQPQVFRGLMDTRVGAEQVMRFCMPFAPNQKRPARIAQKYGNVFKLSRVVTKAVAP